MELRQMYCGERIGDGGEHCSSGGDRRYGVGGGGGGGVVA